MNFTAPRGLHLLLCARSNYSGSPRGRTMSHHVIDRGTVQRSPHSEGPDAYRSSKTFQFHSPSRSPTRTTSFMDYTRYSSPHSKAPGPALLLWAARKAEEKWSNHVARHMLAWTAVNGSNHGVCIHNRVGWRGALAS